LPAGKRQKKRQIFMEKEISIRDEYIRLGQALKLAGLAQTGIEAKIMVTEGEVLVNGETDTRRGRKLRDGDRVETKDGSFVVRSSLK
jgi:ribosome-associated protein